MSHQCSNRDLWACGVAGRIVSRSAMIDALEAKAVTRTVAWRLSDSISAVAMAITQHTRREEVWIIIDANVVSAIS